MPFVTVDRPRQEELEACVQCGLCLPHCPTFRLTGRETESPRGRLAAMSAVAAGSVPVDDAFERIMDSCLQCRACEPVCPSLVPFGRAMEGARIEIAAQRTSPARSVRRVLLGHALSRPDLVGLAGNLGRLVRSNPLRRMVPPSFRSSLDGLRSGIARRRFRGQRFPAVGGKVGRVGLLAGCVMEPWFPDVHTATIEVLRRAGYDVVIPPAQSCCGALAAHDGDAGSARRLARRNVAAFATVDHVVANAAGCGAHLKEYGNWSGVAGRGLAGRATDVTELVAHALAQGRLPVLDAMRGPIAVQDPCHLRHAQRIVEQPRTVLRAAGYDIIEIDPSGMCCGAAGVYSVLHPERSAELGVRKRQQILASGCTVVASANPGCEMQLRSHLEDYHRIRHPVELYWEALRESL